MKSIAAALALLGLAGGDMFEPSNEHFVGPRIRYQDTYDISGAGTVIDFAAAYASTQMIDTDAKALHNSEDELVLVMQELGIYVSSTAATTITGEELTKIANQLELQFQRRQGAIVNLPVPEECVGTLAETDTFQTTAADAESGRSTSPVIKWKLPKSGLLVDFKSDACKLRLIAAAGAGSPTFTVVVRGYLIRRSDLESEHQAECSRCATINAKRGDGRRVVPRVPSPALV